MSATRILFDTVDIGILDFDWSACDGRVESNGYLCTVGDDVVTDILSTGNVLKSCAAAAAVNPLSSYKETETVTCFAPSSYFTE